MFQFLEKVRKYGLVTVGASKASNTYDFWVILNSYILQIRFNGKPFLNET